MNCSLCSFRCDPLRHMLVLAAVVLTVSLPVANSFAATQVADDEKKAAPDKEEERTFSGPQPGEKIKPFKVVRIKGSDQAELEVAKKADDRVTLICFVHKMSTDDRILYGLGLVDFYAMRHKEMNSHFVLLSDDREKMVTILKGYSRGGFFNKSIVSLSLDGAEGPGYYGLNRNVAMTVLVAKGDKVVNNFVFKAPNYRDLHAIITAVAKAHGKPEPTLAKLQQELRAERQRKADKRIKASPVFKLAPNEELGRIMFGMVNARGNRVLITKRRNQQYVQWVGDSKERKATLKKYCKAVLDGNFELNQYARAAIEKFAEED